MAFPTLQRGSVMQIFAGDGATPTEVFTLICIASTKSFKRGVEVDSHFELDCASPDTLPRRVSIAKSGPTWQLDISGRADFVKFHTLEGWLDGATHNIEIKLSQTGANGGGAYTGSVILTSLNLETSDNATVTFSASFIGAGAAPTFVAAA